VLGFALDASLGHDGQVFLALAIGALAFDRAATQAPAIEVFAAMCADDFKAVSGLL
jgi:hypothetical protein